MEQKNFNYIILFAILASMGLTIGIQSYTLSLVQQIPSAQTTTLKISGSTTCYPVIATASQSYMAEHENWDIQVGAGGSGGGVTDLENGVVDIAMTSRGLKEDEGADDWVDHIFAYDGVAVIADKSSLPADLTWLTMDELFLIYNGTITDWDQLDDKGDHTSEVGSGSIQVYGRETGSGTRGTFEEMVSYNVTGEALEDVDLASGINTADGNPQMAESIGSTDYAIGYCGMAFFDEADHILIGLNKTDGSGGWTDAVQATTDTVKAETYPISRALHMWTDGPATAKENAFILYVRGPTGQLIVEDEGYVKI